MEGGYWLGVALGLSAGITVGIGIVIIILVLTQYRVPQVAKPLFDCMGECVERHPFGSDEFYDCVARCWKTKQGGR